MIIVFVDWPLASVPNASTCRFMISKLTAGCPFLAIAAAITFVCSASASAFTLTA